ncbi:MAG: N-methyl-L-tryptophan oxidase [Myxococcales bacterium]|nr:N-methyl-L-tryptophan oxidase [Myxococcales bacterium]
MVSADGARLRRRPRPDRIATLNASVLGTMTDTQRSADVIVVGLGGMGAAALLHCARRGARVLGLEARAIGHDQGSSHGQTRLIRQAYFEHPDYVPLLRRAYALWADLEHDAGATLFERTGLVLWGPPTGGRVLPGVVASAQLHNVPIEQWEPAAARHAFPLHRAPDGFAAVSEPGAGFLHVEACVAALVAAAQRAGAAVRTGALVTAWRAVEGPDGGSVDVDVGGETLRAARLILAQGAWSGAVLRDLGVDLRVHRNVLVWLEAPPSHRLERGAPCFGFDLPATPDFAGGFFYGFPALDEGGVKAALHLPGDPVTEPDHVERATTTRDSDPVVTFAARCLPGVGPRVTRVATCLYEMTPDEHFVVQAHPRSPQVVVAGGFSGHGFKFAPVIGEALAQLALDGRSALPIGFLDAQRFQAARA